MCAIFGSFNKETFVDLAELNSYRGQHSYSISLYDTINHQITVIRKEQGKFDCDGIVPDGKYLIGHIQAPTTAAKDMANIHPSYFDTSERSDWYTTGQSFLWHNGIIKEDMIKTMQLELDSKCQWDTKLLHEWYRTGRDLSDVDGTFSCLLYLNGLLYTFRNQISPMFWDERMNISSTKFVGAQRTDANSILYMDFVGNAMVPLKKFTTKENPYYFANGA